jgi:hypothetical protein
MADRAHRIVDGTGHLRPENERNGSNDADQGVLTGVVKASKRGWDHTMGGMCSELRSGRALARPEFCR